MPASVKASTSHRRARALNRRCRIVAAHLAALLLAPAPALLRAAAPVREPDGYWTGATDAPVPATLRGARVVHVAQVGEWLAAGRAIPIDVSAAPRKPEALAPGAPWMPVAHQALPGAIWLPGLGADTLTPAEEDFFRDRLRTATAGDAGVRLVVYCHAACWLSWNAAKRALAFGYRQVAWFPDGIEGWTAAGRPTTTVPPQGPAAAAESIAVPRPSLVVLDLELTGDLGGPEFAAEHALRLQKESARLRQDLERTGLYRLVDTTPARALIDELKSRQEYLHDCNGCDLDIGKALDADRVMVAWVDRVSGLILSLTYEIHDVASAQIVARKSYDFRGDNDNAWNHAIDYMVRDIARDTPITRE